MNQLENKKSSGSILKIIFTILFRYLVHWIKSQLIFILFCCLLRNEALVRQYIFSKMLIEIKEYILSLNMHVQMIHSFINWHIVFDPSFPLNFGATSKNDPFPENYYNKSVKTFRNKCCLLGQCIDFESKVLWIITPVKTFFLPQKRAKCIYDPTGIQLKYVFVRIYLPKTNGSHRNSHFLVKLLYLSP